MNLRAQLIPQQSDTLAALCKASGDELRLNVLRALASDSIRGGLERHFGAKLAFQNCHRVAAFSYDAVGSDRYRAFVSPRGQLLNQSPELRNC